MLTRFEVLIMLEMLRRVKGAIDMPDFTFIHVERSFVNCVYARLFL